MRCFLQHERLHLERRLGGSPQDDGASTTGGSVNTSDIARLMEMFQVGPPILTIEFQLILRVTEFPSQV